ncbi:membrane protein [Tsuneonella deserti]|uniref:Membrane protein n=1 Tax=Tsuneonella deserti TaxID=2035528 RepID=A0ABQ1SB39_9SPHN|nr:MgtC/SapB family protein [Tsuneonella deserti]GGD99450.1 membrane protein [Tsuneonella deserti]
MTIDQFEALGLALLLGTLVGAERGWQSREELPGTRVAGIRTFALLALLGGIAGLHIATPLSALSLLLVAGALLALLLGYRADMHHDARVSATSTIAGVLTVGWGATAGAGEFALASVGTGATLVLLASRRGLHHLLEHVSETDLQASLRLVLVVLVVLPLLPDANLGPFGALNPRRIWLVVVTTGSISFIGYMLARWLGERRGMLAVAIVGSMVSSTAVTLEAARRLREGAAGGFVNAAVPLASAVMLTRSLVLVALLAPAALVAVASAVAPALGVSVIAAGLLLIVRKASERDGGGKPPQAPGLGLALLFAASVAILALASAWVEHNWGDRNAALVIATGGTFDIDAAIAAVGALPSGTLSPRAAALALTAPTLLNTLFKLVLFVGIAGWRRSLAGTVSLALVAVVLGGAVVILLGA